jgi:hypothetical protein
MKLDSSQNIVNVHPNFSSINNETSIYMVHFSFIKINILIVEYDS